MNFILWTFQDKIYIKYFSTIYLNKYFYEKCFSKFGESLEMIVFNSTNHLRH